MKARPILFSGPMVRALLAGRKTQTRRVLKKQPGAGIRAFYRRPDGLFMPLLGPVGVGCGTGDPLPCPLGKPGDLLWVRETTWRGGGYAATEGPATIGDQRRPSIHMFRRDSRLTLRITDVRLERVQEISEADAKAEGATFGAGSKEELAVGCRIGFAALWDTINSGRGFGWNTNPWVWVVEFEVGQAIIIPEGK